MRILFVHNAYQHAGGEDAVVASEIELLQRMGHVVECYGRDNAEIGEMSRLSLLGETLWSKRTSSEITSLIERFRPHVMHVHNTFPLISPAVYWAANRAGVPVVQTLHNFRLMCPQATYLRDGVICEDCSGRLPWRGVTRACYRGSRMQSAVLAGMLTLHRAAGSYRHKVDRYIALNDFCREKFIAGGLPAERIVIKPNFVDLPRPPEGVREGFLFVGRLSPEKGVSVLSRAMRQCPELLCNVVGSGAEKAQADGVAGIHLHGALSGEGVRAAMVGAVALILPSICYESFPRTLVEAYAAGTPVIASRLGAMAELVEDGVTGLLFAPGDPDDLARCLRWAQMHPEAMRKMGMQARQCYETRYTAEHNYRLLMSIYASVGAMEAA